MRHTLIRTLCFFIASALSSISLAEPWYTGPLLAPAGHTIPTGRSNFEVYEFLTNIIGSYSANGVVILTPGNQNLALNPIFSHGISKEMDIQFVLPFNYNRSKEASSRHIGDSGVVLGYQALEQQQSLVRPDLRITVQEIIPTGRYDKLKYYLNGTDATGLGSYQTGIGFNFQHLLRVNEMSYLRTRFSYQYVYAAKVHLRGRSVYGGNILTRGVARPGNLQAVDLAAELNLTQNWVAVMEGFASKRESSHFIGIPGINRQGLVNSIGYGVGKQITLAPAIEYNFTENIGIIGGTWFSISGRSTAKFSSAIVALNMFW